MSSNFKAAIFISLIWHVVCFSSVELTFGKKVAESNFELTKIFFLGPILQKADYYPQSTQQTKTSAADRLKARNLVNMLKPGSSEARGLISENILLKKPPTLTLAESKVTYFKSTPSVKVKKADSSIMFYPPMPYHFLLYFKDRQVAHMEVAFYISPDGKIAGLKRKISTGNPEVDLLIMRNLSHFLNLCKSNFSLSSWQTVKIDLSP
jgi:hypothetical protein